MRLLIDIGVGRPIIPQRPHHPGGGCPHQTGHSAAGLDKLFSVQIAVFRRQPLGLPGNGRVGRIIINTMLAQAEYPQVIFDVNEKERYYTALEAYDGLQGNPQVEPMQIFLAELVIRQLDELLEL